MLWNWSLSNKHNKTSGDMLGEQGEELWKAGSWWSSALTPWPKRVWDASYSLGMQFTRWSHKIEGTSGAALWLKEHGNQSKSPLWIHMPCIHQNQDISPPLLEARVWENATAFPPPLSRSLIESREGKPHDPLFLPAKETAVNDKVTEQQCLVLAGQKAGGGSVYSPSLLTLQKCSPDDFLLQGNDWQVPLLWGFTSRGKRSKTFHRGAKTKVRRV